MDLSRKPVNLTHIYKLRGKTGRGGCQADGLVVHALRVGAAVKLEGIREDDDRMIGIGLNIQDVGHTGFQQYRRIVNRSAIDAVRIHVVRRCNCVGVKLGKAHPCAGEIGSQG